MIPKKTDSLMQCRLEIVLEFHSRSLMTMFLLYETGGRSAVYMYRNAYTYIYIYIGERGRLCNSRGGRLCHSSLARWF